MFIGLMWKKNESLAMIVQVMMVSWYLRKVTSLLYRLYPILAEEPLVTRKRGREEHTCTKRNKGNDTMNNSCQPGNHNPILTKRKNIQQWASVVTTSCTSMVTTPCTEVPVKCSTPCVKDFSILGK